LALPTAASGSEVAGNLDSMTLSSRLYGLVTGGLLSVTASLMITLPAANADPQQQCNTTVGQSASQTVQSYLDRHPDVRAELTAEAQAESPGGNNSLIDYLGRHPDVRQALITLANQCTS
jgi:hypothetical protein